jgi:Lamin Tail Domain/Secretion system C-terminal sorting domain/PKD domain
MKRILFVAACMVASLAQSQLKLTYLDPTLKELKVKNYGAMSVDISTYRLCSSFVYKTLNQTGINILAGDFNLATGEEVYFSWTDAGNGFTTAMDDMGLYLPSGSFSTAANMVDFVEWGASGQGRENVAIAASLWSAGQFLEGDGPWEYIGTGSSSGLAQWDVVSSGTSAVVINEVDCDQIGTDAAEFVELYGEPNAILDGLVVVFFNGSSDVSYASFDLDGYALDNNGFFVLGNPGVNGAQIIFDGNTLQNGTDAVVVYVGDLADWPIGTPVSSDNLVDAMVYATSDADDLELLTALIPTLIQVDEAANGNSTAHSSSRVPDGGSAFDMSTVVAQNPTPGATNIAACSAGSLLTTDNGNELIVCAELPGQVVEVMLDAYTGDSLVYLLADENDFLIATFSESSIDFNEYAEGIYRWWAIAFTGVLDNNSLVAGGNVNDIVVDGCLAFSQTVVVVTKVDCTVPICDGGEISVFTEGDVIGICGDENQDVFAFITNSTADPSNYTYVIADTASTIVALFSTGQFDFNILNPGTYQVYGLSYIGSLDVSTIEQGDSLAGIMALDGECTALSFNQIVINVFDCESGPGCTDLYFSQYLEGTSGNNKALEIYNPTPFDVDLSDYVLRAYNNASLVETALLPLSGVLAANETFVITHPQADQVLLDLADITGGVANFNGDDALVLFHNDEAIDVIGVIGENPSNGWPVAEGSTQNHTLIRKPTVNEPTTIWGLSATQWLVAPGNDFSNIGLHSAFFCSNNAYVSFSTTAQQVSESVGQVQVTMNVSNVTTPFDVVINVLDESMIPGEDYIATLPMTINVDGQNSTYVIDVTIVDDAIEEDEYEFVALGISVESTEVTVINEIHVISVEPSDQQYPLYTIADVTTDDANGITDSLSVFCELRGIVHGINFNSDGTHFHIIDGNAGIKVFDADEDLGYVVTEGDSVAVRGQVVDFLGMTEFYPDTILFLNAGNTLETPQVINTMAEDFESRMVRIECVELVDASQWTNLGNGFDVDVTDGVNSFVMHVDLDTDIFGMDAPEGHFTMIGIGAQMDVNGLPYDSGYSIWPRYLNDMSDVVAASFVEFPEVIYEMDQDVTIDFINTSEGAATYFWDFGDGTTSTAQFPSHTYTYAFLSSVSELTVTLTVDNGAGCIDSDEHTFNVVYNSVDELLAEIVMYPNPVKDVLTIQSSSVMDGYLLMDAYGKLVQSAKIQSKQLNVNTQELALGIYFIHLHTAQGDVVRRLIKE